MRAEPAETINFAVMHCATASRLSGQVEAPERSARLPTGRAIAKSTKAFARALALANQDAQKAWPLMSRGTPVAVTQNGIALPARIEPIG